MEPSEVTWTSVEPLVAEVDELDGGVEVTFRCPRTGVAATAFGAVRTSAPGPSMVGGKLMGSVREGIGRSVRRAVSGGLLPGGVGAAVYKATAKVAVPEAVRQHADKQAAVVAAFSSVQDRFRWDDAGGAWVGRADPASPPAPLAPGAGGDTTAAGPRTFASQLAAFPIATERDRGVLFRILAAVVAGDGEVGDHERAVFAGMAPGADLASLLSLGLPGPFELASVSSAGTKETILLLAWSVAVTDERLGAGESAVLDQVAAGLGVDAATVAELRGIAQRHVVDTARQALAAAGWTEDQAAEHLAAVARAIGAES